MAGNALDIFDLMITKAVKKMSKDETPPVEPPTIQSVAVPAEGKTVTLKSDTFLGGAMTYMIGRLAVEPQQPPGQRIKDALITLHGISQGGAHAANIDKKINAAVDELDGMIKTIQVLQQEVTRLVEAQQNGQPHFQRLERQVRAGIPKYGGGTLRSVTITIRKDGPVEVFWPNKGISHSDRTYSEFKELYDAIINIAAAMAYHAASVTDE